VQVDSVAESAKAAVAGAIGQAVADQLPDADPRKVKAVADGATASLQTLLLMGKYRWSGGHLLQGDVVSEPFELCDEASGLAFGVAAGEVVAPEVAVELTGGEDVPAGADDRVLDRAEGSTLNFASAFQAV